MALRPTATGRRPSTRSLLHGGRRAAHLTGPDAGRDGLRSDGGLEAPHTIVYHWWEKSKSGKLKFEGWPSYYLQPSGDSETLVRHRGKMVSYGVWRLGTPIWRRFAIEERTITVDALKASFERNPSSAPE